MCGVGERGRCKIIGFAAESFPNVPSHFVPSQGIAPNISSRLFPRQYEIIILGIGRYSEFMGE